MLGITKLNTTASHPQCDGAVERFNRTLKTMIRKHVMKFGVQWDQYLHGILWAYRNTPHTVVQLEKSRLICYSVLISAFQQKQLYCQKNRSAQPMFSTIDRN